MRIVAFIALLVSLPAWSAEWVALPMSGNDQYFYDRSKLLFKDDEVTYWKKVQFKTPQQHKGSEVSSGVLRERINCAEHSAKLISYLYYSPGGETVEYVAQDESAPFPIVPDTVGDAFDRVLCPMVWRKQEEARIKGEQKAAETEIKEVPKSKEDEKRAPAKAGNAANSRNIEPPTPPANANVQKAPSPATPKLPNVRLPSGKSQMPIPDPQILEQLY